MRTSSTVVWQGFESSGSDVSVCGEVVITESLLKLFSKITSLEAKRGYAGFHEEIL